MLESGSLKSLTEAARRYRVYWRPESFVCFVLFASFVFPLVSGCSIGDDRELPQDSCSRV